MKMTLISLKVKDSSTDGQKDSVFEGLPLGRKLAVVVRHRGGGNPAMSAIWSETKNTSIPLVQIYSRGADLFLRFLCTFRADVDMCGLDCVLHNYSLYGR